MRSSISRNHTNLLIALGLLFVLLQAHAFVGRFTIIAPGIAVRLDEIVQVSGGRGSHPGAFLVTAVYAEPAGLLSLIYAAADPRTDVAFQSSSESVNNQAYRSALELSMQESEEISKAVALRASGFTVPECRGLLVRRVTSEGAFAGKLRPGDLIVGLDGVRVESKSDLVSILSEKRAGDAVSVEVDRRDKAIAYVGRLSNRAARSASDMGVSVVQHTAYQLPMAVDIDSMDIKGSSAGLMFALEIFAQLSKVDLTHGLVVAGTGALEPNGDVSAVSGVKQKVIAAQRWGADIFVVPEENLDDARPFSQGMKLISVSSFSDCVRKLEGVH